MKKETIENKVYKILMKEGKVDNFRCIDTRLTTRLGAIIFSLKEKGKLDMLDEERCGFIKGTKNYCYYLKKPLRWEIWKNPQGDVVKKVPVWHN